MSKPTQLNCRRDPAGKRRITITLPEFLVQALEHRVVEANAGDDQRGALITLDKLVELELAETLSVAEVALLEGDIPGISDAVTRWIHE